MMDLWISFRREQYPHCEPHAIGKPGEIAYKAEDALMVNPPKLDASSI